MPADAPHLVVAVSGHGLGHLGQVAPVLQALRRQLPALRVTLRTARPAPLVARQLGLDAAVAPPAAEAPVPMRGPLTVDAAGMAQGFAALHADWPAAVTRERQALARLAPDAVLADVPYTILPAAAGLGVPATALCSFNWLEAYAAYAGQRPEARRIQAQIHAAYEAADRFLQPRPHTAMHGLTNTRSIAPVARVGTPRSRQLRERLGVGPETALVLITWGGMGGAVFSALPRCPGVVWLQPDAPGGRPDVRDTARIGLAHTDLIASVDAVVTKSGYATLAEALAAGTRVCMVSRPAWPEDAALRRWLAEYGTSAILEEGEARPGRLAEAVAALLARPRCVPVTPAGCEEAAAALRSDLGPAGSALPRQAPSRPSSDAEDPCA